MWAVSWFIGVLLRGRSAKSVETAFWGIVIVLFGIFFTAWLLTPPGHS